MEFVHTDQVLHQKGEDGITFLQVFVGHWRFNQVGNGESGGPIGSRFLAMEIETGMIQIVVQIEGVILVKVGLCLVNCSKTWKGFGQTAKKNGVDLGSLDSGREVRVESRTLGRPNGQLNGKLHSG